MLNDKKNIIDEKMIPMGTKECTEHRAKLKLPNIDKTYSMPCKKRFCYDTCPIISKKEPKKIVFEEIKPDKKEQKKISKEVEDFLWMQQRVISKLAWRPEIWKALDRLSTEDILDKLLGKDELATVPTMAGGKMPFQASKQTKKMFADLENQFAEEDEKTGKPEPKDFEQGELTWIDEPKGASWHGGQK